MLIEKLDRMEMGERIRAYRQLQGLTQGELARLVEVKTGHISLMESGAKNPSVKTLSRMAKALGVSSSHLLGEIPFLADMPLAGE